MPGPAALRPAALREKRIDIDFSLCYDADNVWMRKSNRNLPAKRDPGWWKGERHSCEYPSERPPERRSACVGADGCARYSV